MRILGVTASSYGEYTSFESIATATGTGSSATLTFSSIPTDTYTHLQIRMIMRSTSSNSNVSGFLRFNSDSGSGNYRSHFLEGDGSIVAAGTNALGSTSINMLTLSGNGATASTYSADIIDILDYRNTNKYKTVRILHGFDRNGSGFVQFQSGVWLNTNAITSISITLDSGNFDANSVAALYGIKGAA